MSCNLQFFSELLTIPLREFHMVSPQDIFTLLIFLTMQSYKFYLHVIHYSKDFKEHVDIMSFIERYPLKTCQGCVKLIASKVNCFLNITDLSEVQLCMSSNSWT